jgi:hypothetical protein
MKKIRNGFSTADFFLISALIAIVGSAIWYSVQKINNASLKNLQATSVTVSPNYDEATRTLNGQVVDFSKCSPDTKRFDASFGTTTVEVLGKQDGSCIVKFGSETEDPRAVGVLTDVCNVPTSLGTTVGFTGTNTSSLAKYCTRIK